ncbi:RidA family protein [Aromatoleum petrolei]|uniref:RidA family protein n=1 Tax=Aromatoleum petrolei TaxID=76116 RepID=A0ABX1MTA9_9RHOO|nr:RidA family protein [Aromatoleum petrolei]NMF89561.1 RidA family protein [Aromatoleum petrolei]QTQ37338.1 RutC-like superfamily protein [Aromatoleum petrolei]
MSKRIVLINGAPTPVGPCSQGVVMDGWVWTSGQVGLNPATGELVGPDVATQANQALHNIEAILRAAGSGLNQVVRVTVFLTNMDDFPAVNAVYANYFATDFPARSCVEVSRLPRGALVEIDAMARVNRLASR